MLEPSFYKAHLERVSRSFAFCIAELKEDIQPQVALAYLLFRVLDTIEDSKWTDSVLQKKAFEQFKKLCLSQEASVRPLVELLAASQHKDEEALLIKDTEKLFSEYFSLNKHIRKPLEDALLTMTEGMEHFALEKKHQIKTNM